MPPGEVEEAQLEGQREGGGGEQGIGRELQRPAPVHTGSVRRDICERATCAGHRRVEVG